MPCLLKGNGKRPSEFMEKDSENVDLDLKEEMKKFKLRIG